MGPRVFVGNLVRDIRERDLDRLFSKYGRVQEITLKNGFGFVEFEEIDDAEDAIKDMDGGTFMGNKIRVEMSLGTQGLGGLKMRESYRGGGDQYRERRGPSRRFGPPIRTDYRVLVDNLSSRVSWQDLKDEFRLYGDVTFADAHRTRDGEGVVEFARYDDMKRAVRKLDGAELRGRRIYVTEDRPRSRSPSYSPRPSRETRRSHSRRRSRTPRRSHSPPPSRSKQHSPSPRPSRSPLSPRRSASPRRQTESRERDERREREKKETESGGRRERGESERRERSESPMSQSDTGKEKERSGVRAMIGSPKPDVRSPSNGRSPGAPRGRSNSQERNRRSNSRASPAPGKEGSSSPHADQ